MADGDESLAYYRDARGVLRPNRWMEEVETMVRDCRYDVQAQTWVFYVGAVVRRQRLDINAIAQSIASKLSAVLYSRRWANAALSRWVGVLSNLKKVLLGIVMGNVIPIPFAALPQAMRLNEADVQDKCVQIARGLAAGEDITDFWSLSCKRICTQGKFWAQRSKRVEAVVVFTVSSVVDTLHWKILGVKGKYERATFTSFLDPINTIIGITMSSLLTLLQTWSIEVEGPWSVLQLVDAQAYEDQEAMMFAFSTTIRIAASIFVRFEQRLSGNALYGLQWLISDHTALEDKEVARRRFCDANACCLGNSGRQLRQSFQTLESTRTPLFQSTVFLMEQMLRFSIYPAEQEHKQTKDDVSSLTKGTSQAVCAWRSVARQLQSAHLARGGNDLQLPLRRCREKRHHQTPAFEEVAIVPVAGALEDAQPSRDAQPARDGSVGDAMALAEGLEGRFVGCNNPKIAFANFRLRNAAVASGASARNQEDVKQLQRRAFDEYDGSLEIQARWRALYTAHVRRRRFLAPAEEARPPAPSRLGGVWESTMQLQGDANCRAEGSPIASAILRERLPSSTQLDALSQDPKPFTIRGDSLASEPALAQGPTVDMWGCGCRHHNVCQSELAKRGVLRGQAACRGALSRWVDTLSAAEKSGATVLLELSTEGPPPVFMLLLLAHVTMKPKSQIYARCLPLDAAQPPPLTCPAELAVPSVLRLLTRGNRLCISGKPAFPSLYFETSDEIAQHMMHVSDGPWFVSRLQFHLEPRSATLMHLHVRGKDAAVDIGVGKAKKKS